MQKNFAIVHGAEERYLQTDFKGGTSMAGKIGIYINSSELAVYLGNLPTGFWQGCKIIALDGQEVTANLLKEGTWRPESSLVKFSVAPG